MPAENKPCPFCGCTLIEEVLIGMNGCDEHVMECTECGCHIHGENLMHARSKWNRRGDIKDEKFTTDNQQSKTGSEDSTQIAAAEKLCKVYFDIAASCIGEAEVRNRVAAATSAIS